MEFETKQKTKTKNKMSKVSMDRIKLPFKISINSSNDVSKISWLNSATSKKCFLFLFWEKIFSLKANF